MSRRALLLLVGAIVVVICWPTIEAVMAVEQVPAKTWNDPEQLRRLQSNPDDDVALSSSFALFEG